MLGQGTSQSKLNGHFTLGYRFETSSFLSVTASAEEIQSELSSLSGIKNILVSKPDASVSQWYITFAGHSGNVALLRGNSSSVKAAGVTLTITEHMTGVPCEQQTIKVFHPYALSGHLECSFQGTSTLPISARASDRS